MNFGKITDNTKQLMGGSRGLYRVNNIVNKKKMRGTDGKH